MRKLILLVAALSFIMPLPLTLSAEDEREIFLVHLKTSLEKDDAQICVAYNIMWAALDDGYNVRVLVETTI